MLMVSDRPIPQRFIIVRMGSDPSSCCVGLVRVRVHGFGSEYGASPKCVLLVIFRMSRDIQNRGELVFERKPSMVLRIESAHATFAAPKPRMLVC